MTQRLLEFLLGIDPAPWAEGGRWRLQWLSLPSGDVALAAIAVVAAGSIALWYLYHWEAGRLGRPVRLLLATLRMGVLLAVAAMICEPVIVLSKF